MNEGCVGDNFCVISKEIEGQDRVRILGKTFQEKKAFKNSADLLLKTCADCPDSPQKFKVILI